MIRRRQTPRHEKIILCLLSAPTIAAAAAKAGVADRTIYRLLKAPAFRQAFDEARQRYREEGAAELARRHAANLADFIGNNLVAAGA
jgi:hypothetical protein